jgi:beta-ribofuranosylaminobenzene 5'-phosphate synthase
MTSEIIITTGARLHFGLLSHGNATGRRYGGVGLMVDRPGCEVAICRAETDEVVASTETVAERTQTFLDGYRANCPSEFQPGACRIEVRRALPSHGGFGSGTQLGLAIAQGLALLAGEGTVDTVALAGRVGRGARSAVGIHGFARGGLLVDGGQADETSIGVLISRLEFPAAWRFLLVTPSETEGLSGDSEHEAFARLEPMPTETTAELSRLLMTGLLPAVVEADFDVASESLYEYGLLVGEYFAPCQGGVFASGLMASLAAGLRTQGVPGVAQTSWGPTCACCASTKSRLSRYEVNWPGMFVLLPVTCTWRRG